MNPALVTIGLFLWLPLFIAIGWVVNRVLKRPAMNGAGLYAVAVLAILVITIVMMVSTSSDPEKIGYVIGLFFFPLLLATFLSDRFQKRKKAYLASTKDVIAS